MKSNNLLYINVHSCTNLPLLGLHHEPQAYVILRYAQNNRVSSISKRTKNPFWLFQSQIGLVDRKSKQFTYKDNDITLYVFNSNKNAEDQLLGWIQISVSQLTNKIQIQSKFQLRNSQNQKINSFVIVSSYLMAKTDLVQLSQTSSIKFQLLNEVQIQQDGDSQANIQNCLVVFKYQNQSIGLKYDSVDSGTFKYKQSLVVQVYLEINKGINQDMILASSFNINNLEECKPKFIKLRFYNTRFPKISYLVLINAIIIPNAYIQESNRCMELCLQQCDPKKEGFIVTIQSPINTILFNSAKEPKRMYFQNGYWLIFSYYEQKQIQNKEALKLKTNDQDWLLQEIKKYKPLFSEKIQINSLRWNNQMTSYAWKISLYKVQKSISVSFKCYKKSDSLNLKLQPINRNYQNHQEISSNLQSISIKNCYFFQVLPPKTKIYLYNVDFKGSVTQFGSFQINQTQTQYVVQTRCKISNQGGTLIAICHQITFKQGKQNNQGKQNTNQANISGKDPNWLQNSYIFKINAPKNNQGQFSNIIYNRNFIFFAKQVSLTKVCKQFNSMIHDNTLLVNQKKKNEVKFKKGVMQIINSKFQGLQSQNSCHLSIGENTISLNGYGSQYLLQKNKIIFVQHQKVRIKFKINKIQYQIYYLFNDIFGNPTNSSNQQSIYFCQIPIEKGKFVIFFKYNTDKFNSKQSHLDDIIQGERILHKYDQLFPIKLKVEMAHFFQNNTKIYQIQKQPKSIKVRICHEDIIYQSLRYQSNSNLFLFNQNQYFVTKSSKAKCSEFIFISVTIDCKLKGQSLSQQGQQGRKWPKFYNGFINIKTIIGKGVIQIPFFNDQSSKPNLFLKITNQTINNKIILENTANKIRINPQALKIQYQNTLTNGISIFKPSYNYYMVFMVNDNFQCIIQFQNQAKNKQQQALKDIYQPKITNLQFSYKDSIIGYIIANSKKIKIEQFNQKVSQKIESSRNQNSIQQLLNSLNFSIIASASLSLCNFSIDNLNNFLKTESKQIYLKQKQKTTFMIQLKIFPSQEQIFKFNSQFIQIIKKAIKINMIGSFQMSQKKQNLNQIVSSKQKCIDVNVLHSFVGIITFKQIKKTYNNKLKPNYDSLGLGYIDQSDMILSINGTQITLNQTKLLQRQYKIKIQKSQLNLRLKVNSSGQQKLAKTIVLPASLKTSQYYSSVFQIQGFQIKYLLKCVSNSITSFGGLVYFQQIMARGSPIEDIKITTKDNLSKNQISVKLVKNQGFPKLTINTKTNTSNFDSNNLNWNMNIEQQLYLIFAFQNRKCVVQMNLAEINLNSIGQSFIHQICYKQKLVFTLKGSFKLNQIKQNNSQKTIEYSIVHRTQDQSLRLLKTNITVPKNKAIKQGKLQIPSSIANKRLDIQRKEECQPQRKQGIRILVNISTKYYQKLEQQNKLKVLDQITVIQKEKRIKLARSKQNKLFYYAYAQKTCQISFIELNSKFIQASAKTQKDFACQIELIQSKDNSFKFIINQNPHFIILANQEIFRIPNPQSKTQFLININLHRFISQNFLQAAIEKTSSTSALKKKLAWLNNSQNDQIITNKFCLYLKHGKQQHVIHNISMQGLCLDRHAQITFGYEKEDDQVDFYLCIDNFWNNQNSLINKQINEQFSYQKIQKQWLQIMPLWHYVLKLSDLSLNKKNIAIQMNDFKYQKIISLSFQLNKIIPRQQIMCLMDISYERGSWGYLKCKINKLGPINFNSSYQNICKNAMGFLKFSIQSESGVICKIVTEPQEITSQVFLHFQNTLKYFYLKKKSVHEEYRLKIQIFLIYSSNAPEMLFYKYYPFTEYLQKKANKQKLFINVNETDSKNKCHAFQIQVQVSNQHQIIQNNMDSIAKQINQVDIISYKDKTIIQILIILLNCSHSSHFIEVLTEIKESFIYEELLLSDASSPLHLFIPATLYLLTDFKQGYDIILEILQMSLVKNQSIIDYLEKIQISQKRQTIQNIKPTEFLYKCLKSVVIKEKQQKIKQISQNKRDQAPNQKAIKDFQMLIGNKINSTSLWRQFQQPQILIKFIHLIKNQTENFTDQKNQKFKYLQQSLLVSILDILKICLVLNESFGKLFSDDILFWIQQLSFKGDLVFQKLIQIIQQTNKKYQKNKITKSTLANSQFLQRIVQIMISRKHNIDKILQFWVNLSAQSQMHFHEQIMKTYFIKIENKQGIDKSEDKKQINDKQIELIKNTKALKFFLYQLKKLQKQSRKQSKLNSVKSSRIQEGQKIQKSFQSQVKLCYCKSQIVKIYARQLSNSLKPPMNISLIASISQLIIFIYQSKLMTEVQSSQFIILIKKWLQVRTKGKANNPKINHYSKEKQNDHQIQIKAKGLLQNLLSQLVSKAKTTNVKNNKNQNNQSEMKYAKFSKYLITNQL